MTVMRLVIVRLIRRLAELGYYSRSLSLVRKVVLRWASCLEAVVMVILTRKWSLASVCRVVLPVASRCRVSIESW